MYMKKIKERTFALYLMDHVIVYNSNSIYLDLFFSTLWANSANAKLIKKFYSSQKIDSDILCKLFPLFPVIGFDIS